MVSNLPDAQPGYRWELQLPDAPRKRRSPWPWIISLIVLAALLVGAWFAGEWLARDIATRAVRTQVVKALDTPSPESVQVRIRGSVLIGLVTGTLDQVDVTVDDANLGGSTERPITGELSAELHGVSTSGGAIESGTASISLDETEFRSLLAQIDGFPIDSASFQGSNVQIAVPYEIFGQAGSIGVQLSPGAADGKLTLTPAALTIGDAQITADDLRSRLGSLADVALRTWNVCVASSIPAGATVTGVTIDQGRMDATATLQPTILTDPAMRQKGTCS